MILHFLSKSMVWPKIIIETDGTLSVKITNYSTEFLSFYSKTVSHISKNVFNKTIFYATCL